VRWVKKGDRGGGGGPGGERKGAIRGGAWGGSLSEKQDNQHRRSLFFWVVCLAGKPGHVVEKS